MRIAVLTNAYPPKAQGGAERIAFEYTEILKGMGHEVKVWVPSEGFYRLGMMSPLARLFFHLRDLAAWKEIVNEITSWKPEVLFTHNLTGCGFATPKSIRYAVRGTRYAGFRWVHVLHDVQLFEPSGQIVYGESFQAARKVWRAVWGWLRKRSLGEPDVVISPTKWLMDEHVKHGFFKKSRKEVIGNPLSHNPLSPPYLKGEKSLLFVGRLDRDKGIDLLLEAWPELKKFSGKLVVVGGGLRLEDFQKKYPEVEFKGQLASEEVLKAMTQSGVLVVPSLVMENQPTVILEGLACDCKVVASDVGGVKETLGEAGWIFKPGSSNDLVRAVREAMENRTAYNVPRTTDEILKRHDPGIVAGVLAGLLKSNL